MVLIIDTKPVLNVSEIILHKIVGDSIEFSVSPTGSENFTYHWLKYGNVIADATTNVYFKAPINMNDAGIYYCEVGDECGSIIQTIATVIVGNSTSYGIYGIINYDNKSSTALDKIVVRIRNIENTYKDSVLTDTTGHYLFSNLGSESYILTATTTKIWGGGNPLDALLVNRYYIKVLTTFGDDIKQSAADVNADGKINPEDALLINRRFIGVVKVFKAGDWKFQTDTVNINSDTQVDIKGICVGDVNGDYKNIPF